MDKLRIAFSGIGAVGGYYGGLLAARYQGTEKADLFFIARGDNLRAIRADGLRIKTGIRTLHAVPALVTDQPAEIGGPVDYLFCCTKSYDLEENIAQLAPIIGPKTVLIPLQNGVDIADRIRQILPGQEVWKGCVYIGARLKQPGFVEKFTGKERIFFGSEAPAKGEEKERQARLLKLLTYARINAFNPADIDTRIWKKFFMISTAATLTSFFNQTIHEALDQHKDMFIVLGAELKSVAEAEGVSLPDDIVFSSLEAQQGMPAGATTSMHDDFRKGRQTELETLTGYVIRKAAERGVEVPTYQFMYNGLTQIPYPVEENGEQIR